MNYDKLLLATLSQDAFFLVNKSLVRKIGGIPAITLSFLIDKYKYYSQENQLDSEKGFYLKSKKEKLNLIESELKIGRTARRSAFTVLEKKKLLNIRKKGHPARFFYYLNHEAILNLISEVDICITSEVETNLTSEVDICITSEVETNLTSEVETNLTYNKNREQKQIIKTEKETSLSYLNLKSKFAEKLKAKNIQYIESRKEYGSISLMQELKIEPKEILDMVDILEEVKKNNPNDRFLQGICFTMSHLVSYRANIYNAHNAQSVNKEYSELDKLVLGIK